MKVNIFIYYGTIIDQSEIISFMKQINKNDLYLFVSDQNLKYRKCGNFNTTNEIIVGHEILWDDSLNLIRIDYIENGIIKLSPKNYSEKIILKVNELEVKNKLKQLGITKEPHYYIITNYEK